MFNRPNSYYLRSTKIWLPVEFRTFVIMKRMVLTVDRFFFFLENIHRNLIKLARRLSLRNYSKYNRSRVRIMYTYTCSKLLSFATLITFLTQLVTLGHRRHEDAMTRRISLRLWWLFKRNGNTFTEVDIISRVQPNINLSTRAFIGPKMIRIKSD
jgi:hypothetical protein